MAASPRVPSVVHLIKTDPGPVGRFLFLNILAILHNLRPQTLYLHASSPLHGFFWNMTRQWDDRGKVVVAPIKPQSYRLQGQSEMPEFRSDWAEAHKSDVIRMNLLKSTGGIYLDTDVLVLRSFDDLRFASDFTMGLQTTSKVCNAVILASPGSGFLDDWYRGMYNASFAKCWDCHSIELPSRLWAARQQQQRGDVNILPLEAFYDPSFSRSDLHELFADLNSPANSRKVHRLSPPYSGKHAVHLWNRVPTAGRYLHSHRLDHVCTGTSMYNNMLRFALNGSAFLATLCEASS